VTPNLKKCARLLCLMSLLSAVGCASQQKTMNSGESLIKDKIPRYDASSQPREYKTPDFVPVTEDIVPLKTKMINIVVRNSSLGDVLHVVAKASGLNLMIDNNVALDQPVTLSLRNVSADDALKTIFSSVDCFYIVTNNMLKVESVGTKVLELGHPALVNTYTMDVGGDILGSSGTTTTGIKGSITSGNKADTKAYDFWESLEKALDNIMGKKELPAAKNAAGATQNQQQNQRVPQQSGTNINIDQASTGMSQSAQNQSQQSITVNRLTGTIMVTATRKNMENIERYIENVRKVLNRQVMIEARIIEVQLNESLDFGIDWSFLDNVKALGGSLSSGFGALNIGTTTLNTFTSNVAAANKFQVGVSRANFQGILTALKTQGDVKTLSNLKINVMNGQAAILTVGDNISYISTVTAKIAATTTNPEIPAVPSIKTILDGMMIGIIPFISETGEITINITPITSKVSMKTQPAVDGFSIETPTVSLREMTTTVKMLDGQMVIIGGLISKKTNLTDYKVPLLGDIPFLGKLFTRINNSETRSELVLLIRPQIVSGE